MIKIILLGSFLMFLYCLKINKSFTIFFKYQFNLQKYFFFFCKEISFLKNFYKYKNYIIFFFFIFLIFLNLLELNSFFSILILFFYKLYINVLTLLFNINYDFFNYQALQSVLIKKNFFFINNIFSNIIFFFIKFPEFLLLFFFFFIFTVFFSFFFISYLGLYGTFLINLISLFLFWIKLLLITPLFFFENYYILINMGRWFNLNKNFTVSLELCLDQISFSFLFLTNTIGLFVFIYTFSYFKYEPLVERLLLLIAFFIISMSILVLSANFVILLLGWELIGISSFFLINFWITKKSTLKSAFKAFVFNKLSDVFLFITMLLLINAFNTLNIFEINLNCTSIINKYIILLGFKINLLNLCCILILLASFIKSAQFIFHIWLPDSMEAPVPASSLIHSATLVSAGIFLILRFNTLIELCQYSKLLLPLVGSITAAYGGIVASTQSDIKKILAYSTISHCGFLMFLCGSFINEYVIIYLYIHGFFKAISFMCVGNVLKISGGYQDFRRMGGYYKYLPFECIILFISLFNLGGAPFSIGFFSKHLLFIVSHYSYSLVILIFFLNFVGALTGVIYSFRLYYYVFFDFKKAKKFIYESLNINYTSNKNYTNTTLASSISISLLLIISYITSFFLYKNLLNNFFIVSDYYSSILNNSIYYYNNIINLYNNINIFVFNITVLIIFFILLFVQWRVDYFFNQKVLNLLKSLIFFFFFLLNYNYIF